MHFLRDVFRQNGYPDKFFTKNVYTPRKLLTYPSVEKKLIYLQLPFVNDIASEILTRRIRMAVNATFYAAKPLVSFKSLPTVRPNLKDSIPRRDQSMLLYKFRCQCGSEYIGQTTRRLCKRIREHVPNWFLRGEVRENVSSAILQHLITQKHPINEQDFSILYRVPQMPYKSLRRRVLSIAESISIRIADPNLCRQKRLFTSLLLPWPFNSVDRSSAGRNSAVT